ncbi:hypothetical protein PW52_01130 [Tamlana sedimentorum]|uniref:Uncharacterized protein n=1 Tax=Neotamlana sedimentorum TaxID=1435349 RepID=A0A0D7WF21_9FLAO|nr:hypothetical protein [Tamlana sedimentorum]KJD37288.1 hypothetical protein PW52_01130 [Tamlana sedimentorum]
MKIKLFFLGVSLLLCSAGFAQKNLNNYKYVIVQNKYDFLKEADQYQLNSLTKFLFEKYGFEAVLEGENFPEEMAFNRCLALSSDVIKDSGMFKTKLSVQLKDCNGALVFTSQLGESREKEYKVAYHEALRDAFKSIELLNHKYEPKSEGSLPAKKTISEKVAAANVEKEKEVARLKQELEALKKERETSAKAVKPIEPQPKKVVPVTKSLPAKAQILYAQETPTGFQLVDSTPKVVFKIKKTGRKDLFLVEGEDSVIYKQDNKWIYEYNTDAGAQQKELNINF